MKKMITLLMLLFALRPASAQNFSEWFRQKSTQKKYLLEQIAALKVYAGYVKKGYKIGKEGLSTISSIKDGSFNLHRDFFGSLKNVNPAVKRYPRAADIISLQQRILETGESTLKHLEQSDYLQPTELTYCTSVYDGIYGQCNQDLERLEDLVTDGRLTMKDDERLAAIDKVFDSMQEKYSFCRHFSNAAIGLAASRQGDQLETGHLKKLNGF